MKKILLSLFTAMLVLVVGTQALAFVETAPQQKPYSFKFKIKDNTFEYTRTAASYDEAYESAAQACFTHYKEGRHLNEDEGLSIIDVCANPHKS